VPRELAAVDLAACVEPLSAQVSYLAAQGLAMRWLDTHGSTAAMLDAVAAAAPQADVLLVHASAVDLVRLLGPTSPWRERGDDLPPVRPVLLVDDRPASVTHAYAAMKWLSQRGDFWVHDLLLAIARTSPRAAAIPQQIAGCADRFIGARISRTAWIDPAAAATAPTPAPLRALISAQLGCAVSESIPSAAPAVPVAALAPRRPPTAPSPRRTRHAHPEH
jgi:flagellar biosynthesis protein FlhG